MCALELRCQWPWHHMLFSRWTSVRIGVDFFAILTLHWCTHQSDTYNAVQTIITTQIRQCLDMVQIASYSQNKRPGVCSVRIAKYMLILVYQTNV